MNQFRADCQLIFVTPWFSSVDGRATCQIVFEPAHTFNPPMRTHFWMILVYWSNAVLHARLLPRRAKISARLSLCLKKDVQLFCFQYEVIDQLVRCLQRSRAAHANATDVHSESRCALRSRTDTGGTSFTASCHKKVCPELPPSQ